jgi:endoglucanase
MFGPGTVMVRRFTLLFLILFAAGGFTVAQAPAHDRARRLGLGMNLSYLDNWWSGTKDRAYSDFVKPAEAAKREKMFADIAKAGFKTVRVPINFGAWASHKAPYRWERPDDLKVADQFIGWALSNGLNVIVDLHHVEFDGSIPGADATERIAWIWKEVAGRYRHHDPERVLFELRNEPHDIKAEDWRRQAEVLIKTVRSVAPQHTLVVGFHDWNSRQAMIDSKPFADANIIYTFHYYEPFIFTHQGATWSAKGLPELKGVPFPAGSSEIRVPETAKGTWVETRIRSYAEDAKPDRIFEELKAAKEWSVRNKVPIFLGEFGSFGKYPTLEDRCRHAAAVYSALGKLEIPNAWWEWDGGFTMFAAGGSEIAPCMREAVGLYIGQRTSRRDSR